MWPNCAGKFWWTKRTCKPSECLSEWDAFMGVGRRYMRVGGSVRISEPLPLPDLARGASPWLGEDGAVNLTVTRPGFAARAALPRRPSAWVVIAGGDNDFEALEGGDWGVLRVERPKGGNWAGALAQAVQWLGALPEARGLPVALVGAGEGREGALAATAALGPPVDALLLDAEASGPVVLTPTLVGGDDAAVVSFLTTQLPGAAPLGLSGRQRRLLARRLERRLRRQCRRHGPLTGAARAAIAALAVALAFTISLGAGAAPAGATVTPTFDPVTGLTLQGDGAADSVVVACNGMNEVTINGTTLPGGIGGPDLDPNLNCQEPTSLTVSLGGGADTLDLSGVAAADFINLNGGDVTAQGEGGADSITGTADIVDLLIGGSEDDTLSGGNASDSMRGSAGDDSMLGHGGSDVADYSGSSASVDVDLAAGTATGQGTDVVQAENAIGSVHDDTLHSSVATSTLTGGDGDDSLEGNAGHDTLLGGVGADTLSGAGLSDSLDGDVGADSLDGGSDSDVLSGGDNDDTLAGGAGDDTLGGDAGSDLVDFSASVSAVDVQLELDHVGNPGVGSASGEGTDQLLDIEQAQGSGQDDTLVGGFNGDTLLGGGGADSINGDKGGDSLDGGVGADSIDGSYGADDIFGNSGNDTLRGDQDPSLGGGGSNDTIGGGGGSDLLIAQIIGGPGGSIVLSDTAVGGSGTDSLGGDIERASLEGNDGDNALLAGAQFAGGASFSGQVTIEGGDGDDTIRGAEGNDSLDGGAGTNLIAQLAPGNQTLTPTSLTGLGTDTLSGFAAGALSSDGSGPAVLDATGFDSLPVTLSGGIPDDTLLGGDGDDVLSGSNGVDSLNGGGGDDLLQPGITGLPSTHETVEGGAGLNTVDYSNISSPVDVNLATGEASMSGGVTDSLDAIRNALGSTGADILTGDGADNLLAGEGGDDTLEGAGGSDTLEGGAGNDLHLSHEPRRRRPQRLWRRYRHGAGRRAGHQSQLRDGAQSRRRLPGGHPLDAGGPPGPTPPIDSTPPLLTLSGSKTQHSKKKLAVKVHCDEACTVSATGTIAVPKIVGGKVRKRRNYAHALKHASTQLAAGQRKSLGLKVKGSVLKLLKRAFGARKSSHATITVTATDAAGNTTAKKKFHIKVNKKAKKKAKAGSR